MPFFSVIVSTYNRAAFLDEAVHSVLRQSFTDFELLVIDDGSTDGTWERIDKIKQEDFRVKCFYQKNSERGAARNNGIKSASGLFLVFLDSDDLWLPDHLAVLYHAISKHPDVDFFSNKYSFLNEKGIIFNSDLHRFPEGVYDKKVILEGNPFAVNFCVKKGSDLVLFPEDRIFAAMEDWMFLVMNLYKKKIYISDQITVHMRDHSERSMKSDANILAEKRLKACDALVKLYSVDSLFCRNLKKGSYRFCAIHYYIDHKTLASLNNWGLMVKAGRFRFPDIVLLMKIIMTKKIIEMVKGLF